MTHKHEYLVECVRIIIIIVHFLGASIGPCIIGIIKLSFTSV